MRKGVEPGCGPGVTRMGREEADEEDAAPAADQAVLCCDGRDMGVVREAARVGKRS